jgi:DNA primase
VNRYGASAGIAGDPYAKVRREERDKKNKGKSGRDGMKQSQRLLLTWLIEDTALFDKIKDIITSEDFTEDIYHKAADILFAQYKETGAVNPAAIISVFPEEEEQAEVAGLFNAAIHPVESPEEREKAFWETVIRVKDNSIEKKNAALDPSDMNGFMTLVEDKKQLEKLRRRVLS